MLRTWELSTIYEYEYIPDFFEKSGMCAISALELLGDSCSQRHGILKQKSIQEFFRPFMSEIAAK
jgi:hypothetical protein